MSAVATYNANNVVAGALIVIEVETLPKSIPENSTSISSSVSIGTPTLPTSPNESSLSESNPNCVGKSNATDNPVCPESNNSLNLSFVSFAVEKPAYCLIVHNLSLYIPLWIPRVYGGLPGNE